MFSMFASDPGNISQFSCQAISKKKDMKFLIWKLNIYVDIFYLYNF